MTANMDPRHMVGRIYKEDYVLYIATYETFKIIFSYWSFEISDDMLKIRKLLYNHIIAAYQIYKLLVLRF